MVHGSKSPTGQSTRERAGAGQVWAAGSVTEEEQLELAALVGLAWEYRGGPGFREAVSEIVDWGDRRAVRAYERRQRSLAALVQVLRETDPASKRRT
jgi:hypothetical protein